MNATSTLLRRLTLAASLILATQASAQTAASATRVEDLDPVAAVELFKTLPCPTMEEMNGEFSGEMTSFPTVWKKVFWNVASKNPIFPGIWQGKSFRQTGTSEGRGYNSVWRVTGGKVDIWPMQTSIGPSFFDGKPSFRLVYRAFDHYAGDIHMLDEVRKLPDGRYLGIGRTGDSAEERRMPMPFLLKQRIGDYRQDIGTAREGFDQNAEFKLLEFPVSAYQAAAK